MITLREFLKIADRTHYRIYQPNRDCLIFESYFTIHSPYYFDNKHGLLATNHDYWDNNDYCRGVYTDSFRDPAYDEETAIFLDRYGDMEVIGVEASGFRPMKVTKDKKGNIHFKYVKEPSRPGHDYEDCFNIFIASYDESRYRGCSCCEHSLLKEDKRTPDPKDRECKRCWRFLTNNPEGDRKQ